MATATPSLTVGADYALNNRQYYIAFEHTQEDRKAAGASMRYALQAVEEYEMPTDSLYVHDDGYLWFWHNREYHRTNRRADELKRIAVGSE